MALVRRAETVRLTALLAPLSAASMAGTALAPALLGAHPLLVVALCPRSIYLLGAATHAPLVPLVAVALLRMTAADPLHYRLGQLHGASLLRRVAGRVPADRLGAPAVALSPTGKVLALAGAADSPARHVAVADIAGTLARVALLCGGGRVLAPGTDAVLTVAAPAMAIAAGVAAIGGGLVQLRRTWIPTTEATCVSW